MKLNLFIDCIQLMLIAYPTQALATINTQELANGEGKSQILISSTIDMRDGDGVYNVEMRNGLG